MAVWGKLHLHTSLPFIEATNSDYHAYGNSTKLMVTFMHLKAAANVSFPGLEEDMEITVNTPVGITGNTGDSNGVHLHMGIIYNGIATPDRENYIDPLMFYMDDGLTYKYDKTITQ